MTNNDRTTPLANDWEFAYQLAAEQPQRDSRWPFAMVGVEIDGKRVWTRTPPTAATGSVRQGEPVPARRERSMVSAVLMGSHSHTTLTGVEVHIWQRSGKYLVRGRLDRRPFGETLGDDLAQATARLRQLLSEIENGSYVRSSEARRRKVARRTACRLTLRELASEFIAQKRQTLGRQTAGDYASRLAPVLDFTEQPANLKRWPLAADIDTEFASSLRAFLFDYRSTRNGRAGGKPRPLSGRQVVNVMECLRTLLNWAKNGTNRKLPANWVMPLTPDLVGEPPPKNPLRKDRIPLVARVALAGHMDHWQLCQLVFSLILPLRPDEAAGLLINDVNFGEGWLEFGERFQDRNFTKARTAFNVPFPEELLPVLRACIGGRTEGPLLRSRRAFEGGQRVKQVTSLEGLDGLYQAELSRLPKGSVQSEHDRKLVFRGLLRRLGGISEDSMNKEFQQLLRATGLKNGTSIYSLRAAVTRSMHFADVPLLELRYLTGHATNDIINQYTGLDPVRAMRRYFDTIRPLLDAIASRCSQLGLV